jgi:hypothetical protein
MKLTKYFFVFVKLSLVIAANETADDNIISTEYADDATKQCMKDGTCESDIISAVNINTNGEVTPTSIATATVPFPKMPEEIHAIIHEDWDVLDPRGVEMINTMSMIDGAVEFAHARSSFFDHLKGTFSILAAWGQPEEIKRTGLVHTAYSGDLFQFFLFDSNIDDDRSALRTILGEKAEALTYLFGTVDRGSLCQFKEISRNLRPDATCSANVTQVIEHRGNESGDIEITMKDAAGLLMVTIADYLDQFVDTNGWKDHHQMDNGGSRLYPGNGMPALGFFWFTSICNAIKDHLDVVPSIFNHCETVISYDEDKEARDTYWKVVTEEEDLSEKEQIDLLNKTVSLNPFVGEPNMLLSQIYYRQGKYHESAVEARSALDKFYILASCWDKRRPFEHWIGFSRVMMLRANRMLEGQERSLPCKDPHNPLYVNHNKLELTNLRDAVKEMKAREEV